MKSESMLATEKMLDVVKTLLDEEQPEALFPKILEVAKGVLHADAAVLDIGGEEPLHFSNLESGEGLDFDFGGSTCEKRKACRGLEPAR